MKKQKMTRDVIPEDFTLTLALVDALPVLFFGGSMVLISLLFRSGLFLLGALLCLFAGAAKVLWKLIVVLKKKNIWWLFLQMRIAMPIGFGLMLLALVLGRNRISLPALVRAMTAFPSGLCFGTGALGMVLMIVFSLTLDSSSLRANWLEQLTNGLAQGAIFLGLLLLLM